MRLFVALEIPRDVQAALNEISSRLRAQTGRSVRWVDPGNIHLTLKFIGETDASKRGAIQAALATVRRAGPVSVSFRGIGKALPRVFAVGIEPSPELRGLVEEIERVLIPIGVPAESREFFPHLTLARLKPGEDAARLRSEAQKMSAAEFGRAAYAEFDLMESKLRPKGAEYNRLARFAFVPTAEGVPGAAA